MEEKSVGAITVPKGKVLKDFRFFCKKHGDITDATLAFNANYTNPKGEHIKNPNVYCLACLNEYLEKLQTEGVLEKVAIVPVVGNPEDDGKLNYEK